MGIATLILSFINYVCKVCVNGGYKIGSIACQQCVCMYMCKDYVSGGLEHCSFHLPNVRTNVYRYVMFVLECARTFCPSAMCVHICVGIV